MEHFTSSNEITHRRAFGSKLPTGLGLIRDMTLAFFLVAAIILGGVVVSGARLIVLESGSMSPAYRTGALLICWPRATEALAPGDVIAFRPPEWNTRVVHRIIRVERHTGKTRISTRGDANGSADAWNPVTIPDKEVPVVTVQVPGVGFALKILADGALNGWLWMGPAAWALGAWALHQRRGVRR